MADVQNVVTEWSLYKGKVYAECHQCSIEGVMKDFNNI